MLRALPPSLLGDNILHQSKHRAKGNSEESQKTCVCVRTCVLGWVGAGVPGTSRSTSSPTHTQSDPATRWEDSWHSATAGNVPSWVTSPQRQDGVTSPPPLGPLGWIGTFPRQHWAGGTAVWIYIRINGLQNYLQHVTEDKEEPLGGRGASACAQPQPCQDFPSSWKQKIGLSLMVMWALAGPSACAWRTDK